MFSFLRKKSLCKKAALAGLGLVLLAGLLVMACSNPSSSTTTSPPVNTQAPNISLPASVIWDINSLATYTLELTASSPDGGTLSYQWYETTTGTDVPLETTKDLSLAKAAYTANGTYYFYVDVTNTIDDNSDGGTKSITSTSIVAAVNVIGYDFTDPIPSGLKGFWISMWGEEFTISDTEFLSETPPYGGYGGTIVNHRSDGSDAGYITIFYTRNDWNPDGIDTFYVIHYKELTASTMAISGAGPDEGLNFSDAEATYTVADGYFEYYSDCNLFISGGSFSHPLEGTWTEEEDGDDVLVITDEMITYSMSEFPFFTGAIVDVIDNGSSGYITFRYISNGLDPDLVDEFCVLYWSNFAGTSVDIAIACEDWWGDLGEPSKVEAEGEYTLANGYLGAIDTMSFEGP